MATPKSSSRKPASSRSSASPSRPKNTLGLKPLSVLHRRLAKKIRIISVTTDPGEDGHGAVRAMEGMDSWAREEDLLKLIWLMSAPEEEIKPGGEIYEAVMGEEGDSAWQRAFDAWLVNVDEDFMEQIGPSLEAVGNKRSKA